MDGPVAGVGVEAVEYSQGTGTGRAQFDREQTPASAAVVTTLAAVLDVGPLELSPLGGAVDPEALDALVGVRDGATGERRVTFRYEGHRVRVDSTGAITLTSQEAPPADSEGGGEDDDV